MRKKLLAGLLAMVAACSNEPTAVEPPVFSLTRSSQWSGGEIQVTSAAFRRSTPPVIVAGAETLTVRRVSDSVFAVTVPLGSSGPVSLDYAQRGSHLPIGVVQRVGFRSVGSATPGFIHMLTLGWNGATPTVLGSATNGVLHSLDLATRQVTAYPALRGVSPYGVSPTQRPDNFVVLDSLDRPTIWRLWPTPVLLDSFPPNLSTSVRQLVPLSDSVLMRTSHHYTLVYRNGVAVFPGFGLQAESPWRFYLSPQGDLATIAVSMTLAGVPVFSTATGDTLYSLGAGFPHAEAAGFSPDGAEIYFLGGRTSGSGDSLLAIESNTGQHIAGTTVPAQGFDLAVDSDRALIYVEALVGDRPMILVYNRQLTLLGRLPVPESGPTCSQTCWQGVLGVDRARNQLLAVWGNPSSTIIWTYDLLP